MGRQLFERGVAQSLAGELWEARETFLSLCEAEAVPDPRVLNNLGAIEAALGNRLRSQELLTRACEASSVSAARNLFALDGESRTVQDAPRQTRVAILSLLFNWPSTGGGTVHTKELADFLTKAGYDVRHIYAVSSEWGVGSVTEPLPYEHVGLQFSPDEWSADEIRERFRAALQDDAPDWVIITDSWNTKPLLAEAAADFPYFIRIAALECLCPLNNVRLRIGGRGEPAQCSGNQLSTVAACHSCVAENGPRFSGSLHQAERKLAGFHETDYPRRLASAFRNAAGVFAVNPEIAELFRPHTPAVHVIPSGFDARRFPATAISYCHEPGRKTRILFAGLVQEYMKGFHILQQAGELLWQQRQDFEIWVTGDPTESAPPFLKFVGWQSQDQLPDVIRACDVLVFPTLAQEALGRTAVEAMGCGRPVIASRLGGLAWVVEEGMTGLLCEPGNPQDLATKFSHLLDDPGLRQRLGEAGRLKFEQQFTWDVIVARYRSLLHNAVRNVCS